MIDSGLFLSPVFPTHLRKKHHQHQLQQIKLVPILNLLKPKISHHFYHHSRLSSLIKALMMLSVVMVVMRVLQTIGENMDKKPEIEVHVDSDFISKSEEILNDKPKIKINHGVPNVSKEIRKFTDEEIEQIKLSSDIKDKKYYLDPASWIELFNRLYEVTYSYKTDSVIKNGIRSDLNTYKAFVRTAVRQLGLSKHLNKQTVDDVVILWISSEKRKFLDETRSLLSFQPAETDLIREWVKASAGRESDLDIAVMRHFIWQVRRKLFGLDVYHHMMPILYGKTGGGKSRAVLQLLKPLENLTLHSDLSIFSDQFKMRQFTKMYVMFFDEMAKSDRVDIDKLKNIITSECVDYRTIFTENLESAPQNCTFIGCSNDLVYDKIYDPTSARRYWQLDCADKLDWAAINAIDYLALWKSVDENAESPIMPFLDEIKDIQEKTIRSRDLVEDWLLTECELAPYDAKKNPTSQQLYHHFSDWCKIQKINNQPTAAKFYRRLDSIVKHLNLPFGPHKTNRGTVWTVSTSSATATLRLSTVEEQKRLAEEIENQEQIKSKLEDLSREVKILKK